MKNNVKNIIINFLDKLNYTICISEKYDNIDYINKIIYINNIYNIEKLFRHTINILFYNTPNCVYKFFGIAYTNKVENNYEKLKYTPFYKYLLNILYNVGNLSFKYRDKNVYGLFNHYVNKDLVNNLDKASFILLSKMFDDNDSYFKKNINGKPININNYILDYNVIYYMCIKYKGCISGSFALACYGTVYRKQLHDIDFIIPYNVLNSSIIDILNKEVVNNKPVGKNRKEIEDKIKNILLNDKFIKDLICVYKYNVKIEKCVIDRLSNYDKNIRLTLSLQIENKKYDIIFKDKFNRTFINTINTYVQDIEEILYNKRLLGRPKDFQDLINYKPYNSYTK